MWYGPDCHRLKNRHATWVSHLLKRHYDVPDDAFQPVHCFFGLHLLGVVGGEVCVVEAEKTAVICSELYPQYLWLAAGGMNELQLNKFFPLRHHKVILFPDTDPDSMAFTRWYDAAQEVMKSFFWPNDNPIRVSPLLERVTECTGVSGARPSPASSAASTAASEWGASPSRMESRRLF